MTKLLEGVFIVILMNNYFGILAKKITPNVLLWCCSPHLAAMLSEASIGMNPPTAFASSLLHSALLCWSSRYFSWLLEKDRSVEYSYFQEEIEEHQLLLICVHMTIRVSYNKYHCIFFSIMNWKIQFSSSSFLGTEGDFTAWVISKVWFQRWWGQIDRERERERRRQRDRNRGGGVEGSEGKIWKQVTMTMTMTPGLWVSLCSCALWSGVIYLTSAE